jgi:cob(I)alamin adenosyltransferase
MAGLLIVYTGLGKGKTSAAIGALVRTLGNGGRAAYIQFMKGAMKSSERTLFSEAFADRVLVICANIGFFRNEAQRLEQAENAAALWQQVRSVMAEKPPFDLIVLDELNYVMHHGLLDEKMVLADLGKRGETHVVVTGRHAPDELLEHADTVSEIKEIKHAYQKGLPAVPGIDY